MVATGAHTICGRSRESLPIVLKTKSCSLFTVDNKSSPRAAMAKIGSVVYKETLKQIEIESQKFVGRTRIFFSLSLSLFMAAWLIS